MKSYGQYCPIARASEILGQRWTMLVLRDLLSGVRRFNDIRRGVPLMSPSLLSRRLGELEQFGLIERVRRGRLVEYTPTEAAYELKPAINLLGAWGQRWLPAKLQEHELDVSLLMWDVRLRVAPDQFGRGRTVIKFEFSDRPRLKKNDWWLDQWWLVMANGEIDLCVQDPGWEVDLLIVTDLATMTAVWLGNVPVKQVLKEKGITLQGSRLLAESFERWLPLSAHAQIERPPEPLDLERLFEISQAEIPT